MTTQVTKPCTRCRGCGQVADTPDAEPWTVWMDLPVRSAVAVVAGLVRPKPCPTCDGAGVVAQEMPRVACLCGSTRFYREFQEANFRETMAGHIVLSVGFYSHAAPEAHGQAIGITSDEKDMLDVLHLRKIDLADEVLVINVGGYIGDSTRREIAYAREHGKSVRWLEPEHEEGE